ncbi:MAG: hypothetical protein ACTHN5_21490 [Phycisphaerae bacterium]
MVTETAEATSPPGSEVSGLFGQVYGAFGETIKVALKAQEDAVKFWGQAVGKSTPVQAVAGELIFTAEKNADEYIRLMENSYRRNADLLKKALHASGNGGTGNLEKQTREWWEASMEVARDNAQDLANTNLRVAQSWTEALRKGVPPQVVSGK